MRASPIVAVMAAALLAAGVSRAEEPRAGSRLPKSQPAQALEKEAEDMLAAVVRVRMKAIADARSNASLGQAREGTGVVLIEWPDRLGSALPGDRLDVRIDGGDDDHRTLRLAAHGRGHERYLAGAFAAGARRAT